MINRFASYYSYCYIKIKVKGGITIPIIISIYSLLECIEAVKESFDFFAIFIPGLKTIRTNETGMNISAVLSWVETLFLELSKLRKWDLIDIQVAKQNVDIKIRML